MLYMAWAKNTPYIKIGFTSKDCVNQRIGSLQTGCPFELINLAFIPGTEADEAYIHSIIGESRIRGEWFMFFPGFEWGKVLGKFAQNLEKENTSIFFSWIFSHAKTTSDLLAFAEAFIDRLNNRLALLP